MPRHSELTVLSNQFRKFAETEAVELESPMYAELAQSVASTPDLLELASHCPRLQPSPNLLFASVQYLLMTGMKHPLREYYPILSRGEPQSESVSTAFREFCQIHCNAIVKLLEERKVQTNVVSRCGCLLPAFSMVSLESKRAPLHLIDLGASAGLNLNFHRYYYKYSHPCNADLEWGNSHSNVRICTKIRGNQLFSLETEIEVGSRIGIDVAPLDVKDINAVNWLRALVWPEHHAHHNRLLAAIEEFKQFPATILDGDVIARLPETIECAAANHAIVVYSTISAYQFSELTRSAIAPLLGEFCKQRPIWHIELEGSANGQYELALTRYCSNSAAERKLLARASPHGLWLKWVGG